MKNHRIKLKRKFNSRLLIRLDYYHSYGFLNIVVGEEFTTKLTIMRIQQFKLEVLLMILNFGFVLSVSKRLYIIKFRKHMRGMSVCCIVKQGIWLFVVLHKHIYVWAMFMCTDNLYAEYKCLMCALCAYL